MTESVALAMRAELVEHVNRTAPGRPLGRRRRFPLLAVGIAALIGGGVAAAAQLGVFLPGSTKVTALGGTVDVKAQGSKTIELGPPPAGANRVDYRFYCLSAGSFVFPDGAHETCTSGDNSVLAYHLILAPNEHSIRVTASPAQARWRLIAGYVHSTITAWGINAKGQTYGVQNSRGVPDLVAVIATNGRVGYAFFQQIVGPAPTSPAQAAHWHPVSRLIPVYQPDGTTVIGQYRTG